MRPKTAYARDVAKEKRRVRALLRPFLRPGVVINCGNLLAGEGITLKIGFDKSVGIEAIGDDSTYLAIGDGNGEA